MGIGFSSAASNCCAVDLGARPAMSIPLVLVHDKERSLSETYRLSRIGREVLEVDDSNSHEQSVLERGMPEMAREYCAIVERRVPTGGDIILGGRNGCQYVPKLSCVLTKYAAGRLLGGLIAFEMSKFWADRRLFNVKGVVIIDEWDPGAPMETQQQTGPCSGEERQRLENWDLISVLRSQSGDPLSRDPFLSLSSPRIFVIRTGADNRHRNYLWHPIMGWEMCRSGVHPRPCPVSDDANVSDGPAQVNVREFAANSIIRCPH
jgi:hypothetical protein